MDSATVLILGTDPGFSSSSQLITMLRDSEGHFEPVIKVMSGTPLDGWKAEVNQVLRESKPEIVLFTPKLDRMPAASCMLDCISELNRSIPILVLVESAAPDEVTRILDAGAGDFARLPLDPADLLPRLCRLKNLGRREQAQPRLPGPDTLITQNAEFREQLRQLRLYAKYDATALITGETGTGKELVARALHRLSPRARKPFLPVNCGAIPADLIENEFFGHEPEAFTGASSRRPGLVAEAQGGTLFLDEIDSAPLSFQAKLLRLLQNREFRLVGSTKLAHADVRMIAAANCDLEAAIRDGKFRRDLYYRLNVLRVDLPPLRKRPEDIPLLAQHFVQKYSAIFEKDLRGISPSALEALSNYAWPGNIRELENVVERAVILSKEPKLSPLDVQLPARTSEESFRALKAAAIAEFERSHLVRLLTQHKGNVSEAALAAGKHRRTLFRLMRKHGIRSKRDISHP